jgi:phenylacetate-CoA ligase
MIVLDPLLMQNPASLALEAFHRAAKSVPAYQTLLKEAGINVGDIRDPADFTLLPLLGKGNTFQRFGLAELCRDGELGRLGTVLTSSGHSGAFAFGLTDAAALPAVSAWIDDLLDQLFEVKSTRTLLINCLPMGVRIPTQACTLAETSVRPDMVIGLVKALSKSFAQTILVGDAAFIKAVLELGHRSGVKWSELLVQVIVGEEPLAENARTYLAGLLGLSLNSPAAGVIASSMGVGELGLNLFSEIPPKGPLIQLRRLLHENASLRQKVLGAEKTVPCLFTYDPARIFVEFNASGRLVITTLEPHLRLPLIRYATGDQGAFLSLPLDVKAELEAHGLPWDLLNAIPIVLIRGRGDCALAGKQPVYPEEIKEGLYRDPKLAALTTANFRLVSGPVEVRVRIQLSPDVVRTSEIEQGFRAAISEYVSAPIRVICEAYETFGSGMTLDYERKFSYLLP